MSPISLALGTFIVWITAKGRFPDYARLVSVRDVNGSSPAATSGAGSGSASPPASLPELPPIDNSSTIDTNALNVWNNSGSN